MDLYIRSQDKRTLIKSELLNAEPSSAGWCINEYRYDLCLGHYETEERAFEVLDEIQKLLEPQLIVKDSGKIIGSFEDTIIREGATYELKELSTYVYEMPLD